MRSRVNFFALLTALAIVLLLLVCFAGSAVYADGAGGQIPNASEPEDTSGDGSGTTSMDLVVLMLFFII